METLLSIYDIYVDLCEKEQANTAYKVVYDKFESYVQFLFVV